MSVIAWSTNAGKRETPRGGLTRPGRGVHDVAAKTIPGVRLPDNSLPLTLTIDRLRMVKNASTDSRCVSANRGIGTNREPFGNSEWRTTSPGQARSRRSPGPSEGEQRINGVGRRGRVDPGGDPRAHTLGPTSHPQRVMTRMAPTALQLQPLKAFLTRTSAVGPGMESSRHIPP